MNEPTALVPAASQTQPTTAEKRQPKPQVAAFRRNNLVGYLFVSPWLIGFFLFTFVPMVISLVLAFTDFDLLAGGKFIGLANFQRMFTQDIRYAHSLTATFRYVG